MKAVIKRASNLSLAACPEFVRSGHAVYERSTGNYRLLDLWSLIYFDYEAAVELDDIAIRVKPGYVALLPPGVRKIYRFEGTSPHYTIHFRAESGLGEVKSGTPALPWVVDTVGQWHWFLGAFKEVLGNGPVEPARAQMRVWDLLFRLSDTPPFKPGDGAELHGAVRQAMRIIEAKLASTLQVHWLADQVQLSPNHLTVLFRRHLGQTVLAYIRQRRVEQARHLLIHTDKRVKAIAVEVGMADLHYFNKSIRAVFGLAPRAFRAQFAVNPDQTEDTER